MLCFYGVRAVFRTAGENTTDVMVKAACGFSVDVTQQFIL
jgi:hypothetical protein